MMAQPEPYISEEAYLESERSSTIKHEYFRGRMYAMTGAKESHNLIAANTLASLHSQLRQKPCRVYSSDMRIKVLRTGLNTHPDVVVICGQPQFTDDVHDTIVNPIVIVEVLSASTERYDRGMKFQNYRTIDTLQDYVLISQDHHHVEHYTRQESGLWLLQEVDGLEEEIHIQSIECTLPLKDVYEKVELEQSNSDLPREISPE
ncbi:MAG: Uma2 family endonuclease [Anaerolineae bacterium]|nr:Uma2 family endonuclease [Anaerolineae bacterium]